MENSNTSHTALRILVIGGILAILVFLSIGIVRIVPRAVDALANASVSISSLFKSNTATTTPSGGFIISTSTKPTGVATSSAVVVTDILRATTTPTTGGPSYVAPAPVLGTPDIAVTILSQGIISHNSGQYIETNNFTSDDTIVVKFKVENRGTAPTGIWNLKVVMPSSNSNDQVRNTNGNNSIPAGAAVTGQAIFDRPAVGSNTVFSITANIQNAIAELSTTNNVATTYLNVSGQNNNTNPGNTGYQADLTGQILSVGILDGNNNFVVTNNPRSTDRVAIKFRVSNTGTTATSPWSFRLNFANGQTYTSNESGIAGNTSLTYIIGLQNLQQGYNTVSITLDGNNNVVESNENNNVLTTSFNVTY